MMVLTLTLVVGSAQAGFVTPGLERQLVGMQDSDMVTVLVVMRDQADIRTMDIELHESKATMAVRHEAVLNTLMDLAKGTQTSLLADLDSSKGIGGVEGFTSHWLVNSVVVRASVAKVRDLAAREDVERVEADLVVELIEPDAIYKPVSADKDGRGIGLTPGLRAINAPRVWRELGVDGTGVIIGGIDTGVDGNHPALSARWQGNFAPWDECWLDVLGGNTQFPSDGNSHGTHTMGTMTGLAPDDTIGVAPGAHWIATNVINQGANPGFDSDVLASLEFMADPDGDPTTLDDVPAVAQNSWGVNENFSGYYDCDSRWWDAIDNTEAAGVTLVWSAGNEGPGSQSLRSPADRAASPYNCFSVGATSANAPYNIASYSSRGPSGSGCGPEEFRTKPEVVAPGSGIYSSIPGGGYTYMDGTSMAGPHVAGVVALMKASNPNVDVITIKETLMATAVDLGPAGEENTYGHGMIDAYAAVMAVMGGIGTVDGYITDYSTGLPIEGALVHLVGGWNQDITDADGYYRITMPAGAADFTVTAFGYADGAISTTIPEDANVAENVALTPLAAGIVSGTVTRSDDTPVAGAVVRALNTPVAPAVTGADGTYSLSLPSGAGAFYDMQARATGYGTVQQTVEVTGDITLDFSLPDWVGDDFESGGFDSFDWVMSGTTGWIIDSTNAYEGANSARSGTISHNQSSSIEVAMDVTGVGDLKFWYKVSSESNYDYLRFFVDGTELGNWSGEVDWTEFVYAVPIGNHVFKWTYDKDYSVSSGGDAGWIDFVEFPPVSIPAITVDTAVVDVTLAPGGSASQVVGLGNTGEGSLSFSAVVNPVYGPMSATVEPVPFREFEKGEVDDRAGVSPITGAGGPDLFGYHWMDSNEACGPVYDWIDISSTGTALPSDADEIVYGPLPLGFDFDFYGQTYSMLRVCSDGWMSFLSASYNYNNQGIPTSTLPNALLAPFWDDLNPADSGTIYYQADPGRFIVQFDGVYNWTSGAHETFQAILNADGTIKYQYQTVNDPTGCTVGIENAAGDDGLQVAFNSDYLESGLAIEFSANQGITWATVTPAQGTIMPGGSQNLSLEIDATDLCPGVHYAELVIANNDPANGEVIIPITLTVNGGATPVEDSTLPKVLQFTGAVPNPFNPQTDLHFSLPREARVKLDVYDVSGRLVRSLVGDTLPAGEHSVRWNGRDNGGRSVASGAYFARLVVGGEVSTRSLVLIR
jgi:subtilisin family serine protease